MDDWEGHFGENSEFRLFVIKSGFVYIPSRLIITKL